VVILSSWFTGTTGKALPVGVAWKSVRREREVDLQLQGLMSCGRGWQKTEDRRLQMRPLTDAEYRPILNVQSNQLCPQFRKQNVQFKVQKCAVQQRKII